MTHRWSLVVVAVEELGSSAMAEALPEVKGSTRFTEVILGGRGGEGREEGGEGGGEGGRGRGRRKGGGGEGGRGRGGRKGERREEGGGEGGRGRGGRKGEGGTAVS
jgi:hypothetical protein